MAVLEVLRYPDERLRTIAATVGPIDATINTIIDDMFETMYAELALLRHKSTFISELSLSMSRKIVANNWF